MRDYKLNADARSMFSANLHEFPRNSRTNSQRKFVKKICPVVEKGQILVKVKR